MGPIGIGKRINPVFRREIVFFLTDKWNYIFSYYVLDREASHKKPTLTADYCYLTQWALKIREISAI